MSTLQAAWRASAVMLGRAGALLVSLLLVVSPLLVSPRPALAQEPPTGGGVCSPLDDGACGPTGQAPTGQAATGQAPTGQAATGQAPTGQAPTGQAPAAPSSRPVLAPLVFYWGVGCPHCEEAKPFVASIEGEAGLAIERVEVRRSDAGRDRFLADAERLGITAPGIPLFVLGDRYVIGFREGATEEQVRAMVRAAAGGEAAPGEGGRGIDLPLLGRLNADAHSLPALAVLIGLVDGINPCAMYVLVAMLGILLRVRSRGRLFLFGGTFVLMSGVVYFVFMTAWLNLFALTGLSRWITSGLGAVLVVMGLINLKELFWFKKGVSLMIPDKVKPGMFRRMRAVAGAASLPAALAGIATLAFFVNLVELGCTLGLPAVFTRIVSLRRDVTAAERYGLLALYNAAYVVPLALIVIVYASTLHRITLTERGAKVLKLVSGVLLVCFGVLFVVAPEVLS